jgi:predicted DCC family thiol-disulfide oxidoreductase YuxK
MSLQSSSKSDRTALFILACGALFVAFAIAVFIWFLDPLLRHVYGGTFYAHLIRLRRHQGAMDLDAFIDSGRLHFSQLCLLAIFLDGCVAAWVARDTVRRLLKAFFTTPTSPVNLALFRIAVFGVTLYFFSTDFASTIWYAGFPKILEVAPYGTAWLLPHLPINPQLARIASIVFLVLCVAGVLGLWARASALLASLLGLYVLGITQFYGKVSHDHEYLWFLLLLAVSPCADALSIDAIFSARRRADAGSTALPADSLAYALPLRFASVLLGFIYFFPGFWKFWISGFEWAFSDNLKFQMYSKWTEFPGWLPFFRLDLHPRLCWTVALATLVIEMSFLFLIFFPRLRRAAAAGAASFHIGSYFFLRIFFYDLIVFYIALFDVSAVLRNLGQRLFKTRLVVFYDEDCSFCRRTIAAIRTVDVLDAICYAQARRDADLYSAKYPGQEGALLHDMQSFCGERRYAGIATYHQMARRIPLFWPLALLLRGKAICKLAEKAYERVKHARVCEILRTEPVRVNYRSPKITIATGIVLLAGSLYTGAGEIVNGWPFACFPTFANVATSHISVLQIEAIGQDGRPLPTDSAPLRSAFSDQRARGMFEAVLDNPGVHDERLLALWQLCLQRAPELREARRIRFYRAIVSTIPGDSSVVGRDLLADMDTSGSIHSR